MTPRPQQQAKCPFGRVLQEIIAARNIPTISELALRLRMAGYRRIYQSLISQWMSGASRPKNPLRFCYYLDKALALTPEEQERVAATLGRAEYPRPRQIHENE
jgi:hypothetical protein